MSLIPKAGSRALVRALRRAIEARLRAAHALLLNDEARLCVEAHAFLHHRLEPLGGAQKKKERGNGNDEYMRPTNNAKVERSLR